MKAVLVLRLDCLNSSVKHFSRFLEIITKANVEDSTIMMNLQVMFYLFKNK